MRPNLWASFDSRETRNILVYITGIMFYKLGIESFNGAIVSLAADRFEAAHTFGKIGALNGLNQAMQVVGSILAGPLVKGQA
ncbi:hypothetical protein FRC15_002962 [Serendipita sp. 397]|nr:hypothetical protein FRC15_002962 [Serendipita sp. 397]